MTLRVFERNLQRIIKDKHRLTIITYKLVSVKADVRLKPTTYLFSRSEVRFGVSEESEDFFPGKREMVKEKMAVKSFTE